MSLFSVVVFCMLCFPLPSSAQQTSGVPPKAKGDTQDASGMDMSQMPGMSMSPGSPMNMHPENFVQEILAHDTSGTSAEPDSTPTPMLMKKARSWTLMFHANVFVLDEQQSSARGGDKFFSTNWIMGMAQHDLGPGVFTIRNMLTLEPVTITDERYPLLFQQGETAYGLPIVDGQHPHNFVMELAALYDLKLGPNALLSFYLAPTGDPAIGPTAYPHRASADENPVAALGHHQEDSTHIAADVATTGLTYRVVRIEASGFHGREPGENRWAMEQGKIDSWSTRLTIQPGKNWSGQYSYARITSPEALFPGENQERMTASAMYNRPLKNGNWASTFVWGRTRSLEQAHSSFNSYLFESTLQFSARNFVWTRIESAERSNELLIGENPLPPGFEEKPIGHVQGYTLGYDRDFRWIPDLASAIGAQFTTYGVPGALKTIYSAHPVGVSMFVRLRPFSAKDR
jgi:hypothetical protein